MLTQRALQLRAEGELELQGKSDHEVRKEVATRVLGSLKKKEFEFLIAVHHTSNLLREARKYARLKQQELGALFYATYIEHKLNSIIVDSCKRRNLGGGVAKGIIRSASLEAKCSWVLEVLGLEPIKVVWSRRIRSLADVRNAFVHYKWESHNWDTDPGAKSKSELPITEAVKHAEGIVRYLTKFEDRSLHSGHGRRIKRIFRSPRKATG